MQNFYKKSLQALEEKLLKTDEHIDTELTDLIANSFANIFSSWSEGEFELREDQLYFAYKIALQSLQSYKTNSQEPLALSLGCGEGKQEGFAVAITTAFDLIVKRYAKKPKFLFLTASDDLVLQMKNSIPFKDFAHLYTIDEKLKTHQAKQEGIYICDFKSYLSICLNQKDGASYALFENLDKVFVDEFHALLSSTSHIHSKVFKHINHLRGFDKTRYMTKFKNYKKLLVMVEELAKEYPTLLAHSTHRDTSSFNPYNLSKENLSIQAYLYKQLNNQDSEFLKTLHVDSIVSFVKLLDTISNALCKEAGKDYYLHTKDGQTISYSCASSATGKPLLGTILS